MTGPDREGAIERVIADYLAAEDAGTPPDRAAILASHPELADDLRTFFREHDQFGRLAAPLRADPAPTVDLPGAASAADGKEGPALPPGRHIRYFGDYEILEELGRGGMGVVYKARQISLNRPVALKMIRAGLLAGDDDLRRFQNEAEAVALLDHPGIVPVYEVGELDGQRYFSMKLIEGGGLAPLPEAYRDDPRAAARLVADAAEAMAHAHARGVLHRDLKPANLLIDAAGRPHVTDFGLAKRLAEQVELTQSGAILGTPAYMSPEQAAGRRGTITTAADVYGLGAVLYSLLTGKAPFGGNSLVETLDAVRVAAPAPPTRLNAKVPRDLQTICLKCLEKDPRRRYATAQGLADDLRAWLENRPIAARPAGVLERGALFARRRPALAAAYLLAAAVVSLAAFGGTSAWLWRAAERARAEAEAARSRLAAVEYGRTVEAAHQEWRDDDVAGTIALLDGTRPELRGWEWRYVHSLCHPELTTIVDPKGAIVEASFDTDVSRVATLDGSGRLRFWDAASGAALSETEGRIVDGLESLSRDGSRLVIPDEWKPIARILDVRTGAVLIALEGHTDRVYSAVFDRDGSRVATASEDGTARIWNATGGSPLRMLKAPRPSSIFFATFSPDGAKVATAGGDGVARIWDAGTGEELRTLRGHARSLNRLEFSGDGSRIVTASDDRTARVWDVESGRELLTLRGHTRRILWASFSRDGSRIVTTSEDRTARIHDATNGAVVLTLKGHTIPVRSARFSPDGSRLVTATAMRSEPVRIWDAKSGVESRTFHGDGNSVRASFSPDGATIVVAEWGNRAPKTRLWDARSGRRLMAVESSGTSSATFSNDGRNFVTANSDKTARVYDTRSGTELSTLKGHGDMLTSASFSPDSTRIVTSSNDGTARVWDAKGGTELLRLKGHGRVGSAAFSPDGSRIVTAGGDKTAKAWDARRGVELITFSGHAGPVDSASYSPDGSRIATAGHDGLGKVWDARTGAELLSLKGHTGTLWAVSFSPDGSRILTAGGDGTARLWDATSGTEVLALKGHADLVRSASFSSDGTRIVTGSDDGTARIWDTRPFSVIRAGLLGSSSDAVASAKGARP
jgi:WD40 repeat protein/predicted Ser/Thr protein kinase